MVSWPRGLTNKTDRDRVAAEICNELRAGKRATVLLKPRWDKNEAMYRNEPGASGTQIIDGVSPYHIPLTKPKLDRINGTVHHALMGIEPYVEVTCADEQYSLLADAIEQDLTFLLKKAKFGRTLWDALSIAACTGVGPIRARYIDGTGFELKVAHPNDVSLYPSTAEKISDAKTVGIRYGMMESEVKEKQKKKEWDPKASIISGWNPDEDASGRNPQFDRVESTVEIATQDTQVQLWEVCTYRKFKDSDDCRWWKCRVALDSNQLLEIEPLGAEAYTEGAESLLMEYTKPWLFGLKYEYEYGKFWPSTSLAQHLQGLQDAYSDGFNICWGGSWSAAFPAIVISGGALNEKVTKYRPGDIIVNPTPVQAQVVGVQFNPGTIPAMMQMISETADSVTRVSQMGTATQLRSRTTATETGFLAEMQRQAEDQYTSTISMGLQELFEFLFELYRIHFDDIKATFGPAILLEDPTMLDGKHFLIEVNGKATTNAPSALIEKLQMLLQISQAFPQLGFDAKKIVTKIMSALELPFNVNSLIGPAPIQQGPGGVPGQPDMAMGDPNASGEAAQALSILSQLGLGQPNNQGALPGA